MKIKESVPGLVKDLILDAPTGPGDSSVCLYQTSSIQKGNIYLYNVCVCVFRSTALPLNIFLERVSHSTCAFNSTTLRRFDLYLFVEGVIDCFLFFLVWIFVCYQTERSPQTESTHAIFKRARCRQIVDEVLFMLQYLLFAEALID